GDGPSFNARERYAPHPVDFILGSELFGDVEAGKRIAVVCVMGRILAEPADIKLQHRAAALGQRKARGVLEHLVAQTPGEPGDDHWNLRLTAGAPFSGGRPLSGRAVSKGGPPSRRGRSRCADDGGSGKGDRPRRKGCRDKLRT